MTDNTKSTDLRQPLDELLDDTFHGCAVAAFLSEARATGGWPDQEKTRQRAYQMYEEELARAGE